ncbi:MULTISPECIES: DUF3164 family protein [unclassified Moraxella]|uniref:DUF3164 family protein n=1 Tax=unclassified Moraxella TaxID=2685852 RepID=UPI003AF68C19
MANQTQIPEGYVKNAKGHLVPVDSVKAIDQLRDSTVKDMVVIAKELSEAMREKKEKLFSLFEDFVQLSASEYDTKVGGEKGNTTILSFDGQHKVQLAVNDNIVFDERLQVAKSLIDECLHEWTKDSNDNIKAIIDNAFQVDKEGKINTRRVLGLRSLQINDEKWLKAMEAISDSIQVTSSKEYIRVYERDSEGKYNQIPLDFSNV